MKLLLKLYILALFAGVFILLQECYAGKDEFVGTFKMILNSIDSIDSSKKLKKGIKGGVKEFFIQHLEEDSVFFDMKKSSEIEVPWWDLFARLRYGQTKPVAARGPSEYLLQVMKHAIIEAVKDQKYKDQQYFIDPFITYSDHLEDYECKVQDENETTIVDNIFPFFSVENLQKYNAFSYKDEDEKKVKQIVTTIFENIASLLSETCWDQLKEKLKTEQKEEFDALETLWVFRVGGALRKYCYYVKTAGFFERKWQDIIRHGKIKKALHELVRAVSKLKSLSVPSEKQFIDQLTNKINLYIFDNKHNDKAQQIADYITKQVRSTISFLWHQHRLKMLVTLGLGSVAGFLFYKYKIPKQVPSKISSEK